MLSLQAENFTAPRPDQTETFQISYDYSVHGYNGPIQSGYSAYIYDSVKSWVPTWEVSKPALLQHSPLPRVWLTSLSLLFIPFPLAVSLPSVARIPADRWAWREESRRFDHSDNDQPSQPIPVRFENGLSRRSSSSFEPRHPYRLSGHRRYLQRYQRRERVRHRLRYGLHGDR
jgi:hypothetical protein